jgi:integrase
MNTMNEVFDRYERECVPKLAPRTQGDYARHLKILREYFGNRVPSEIRPRDVGRFLDVSKGKQHRNKQVAVLSAVFSKAMGKWYVDGVDSNPCRNVERHESFPRTRYVTDEEFLAVHAIAPFTVKLMMDLALLTGQRQGDLLDLTWEQVWPEYIDITQGKTGKHLGIRITEALCKALLTARRRPPMMPRWFVVRTRTGEPYTHEGFRALWQRVMADALERGVIKTRFTFHDLRAKCASDKAATGNMKQVSELLGHEDIELTKRVYCRNIIFVDPLR